MKKFLLLTTAGLSATVAMAQLPVSTTPQNKKVVLEEFTGIYCTYCPDGHKLANQLAASKPDGDVLLVNIHTGGYANGTPDFRTPEGDQIAAITGMNISGYPTGSVNRTLFTGASGFAINRSAWASRANEILSQPSYVNVALQGALDENTRELLVKVEGYYTADATTQEANKLTVMLLEDSVIAGTQSGMQQFYPEMITQDGKYINMHMLRKVLNPSATGDVIVSTQKAGDRFEALYSYTIPANYNNIPVNLQNLRIIAFVSEGSSNIVTGAKGPIGGPTSIAELVNKASVKVYPNPVSADKATLSFQISKAETVAVDIIDAMGRVVNVAASALKVNAGEQNISLDVSSLANGMYTVRIHTTTGVVSSKLTINK